MTGSAAPTPIPRPEPVVRGFLFADLRGYTAYVERAGDAAAADLLERYRSLVRGVIAAQAGAEIRTEGDSFYVVFPSPSAAVRAGLELVTRATADASAHPDDPIRVGIGIHAGESAETTEGYVGSAVNVAARICSIARPGEVLVSDTVRSLARTSLPVTYTSRGRPALKGVAEPVELYAVTPSSGAGATASSGSRTAATTSTRARAGLIGLGAAVVVLAVVGIAAFAGGGNGVAGPSPSGDASGGLGGGASPAASAGAVPASPGAAAFKAGPLEAGTYRTTLFMPALELTVPDDWMGLFEIPNALMLGRRDDPMRASYDGIPAAEIGGRLTIMRPALAASPCTPRTPLDGRPRPSGLTNVEIPPGREGFLTWARGDPTFVLRAPTAVRLGAFDTTSYEVALSDVCDLRASVFDSAEVFALAEGTAGSLGAGWTRWSMFRGSRTWWYLWELDRQTMLVAIDTPEEFPEFEAAARSVLTSLAPAD